MSRLTGIPVNSLAQDEKVKLMHLADRLQERIIGQQEAINLVAQAVLRSRAGLDQPGQPIGSFLFLGSTGVGKTELAKALAEQLFGSERMLIRFDMTEFVGSHSVLRLIGALPRFYTFFLSPNCSHDIFSCIVGVSIDYIFLVIFFCCLKLPWP